MNIDRATDLGFKAMFFEIAGCSLGAIAYLALRNGDQLGGMDLSVFVDRFGTGVHNLFENSRMILETANATFPNEFGYFAIGSIGLVYTLNVAVIYGWGKELKK